jgi:hypothetical protein
MIDDPLRYAVETQPRPRSRTWSIVAVCARDADAVYLADTYRDHDGVRARVKDVDLGVWVYDTKIGGRKR